MAFQQGETVTAVGKFQDKNQRVCDDSRATRTLSSVVRRPSDVRVVGLFVAERGFRNVFRIFCYENGIILIMKYSYSFDGKSERTTLIILTAKILFYCRLNQTGA